MFENELTVMKDNYVLPWLTQIAELEGYMTEWLNDEAPLDLEFLEALKYSIAAAAAHYHDYANSLLKEIEKMAKTEEVILYLEDGNYCWFKNTLTTDKFEVLIAGSDTQDYRVYRAYQIERVL